jgi:glutamate dehydrogenase
VAAAVHDYVGEGVPEALATRVVALDSLYSTLDIVEVAAATKRPVELVAEIYFALAKALELPWLSGMIMRLSADKHWQRLARNAMQDDLSGLQRTIAGEILSQDAEHTDRDELLAAWRERNRRPIERVQHLLAELRSASTADAAMLAVALRELRNLG